MDKQTRLCPECGKEGWLEVADTRTTPTPPAGQVEAVAALYAKYKAEWSDLQCPITPEEEDAYKAGANDGYHMASGAEHIAGRVAALEDIIATPDRNDTQWKQGRKAGIAESLAYIKEALPPELRGK